MDLYDEFNVDPSICYLNHAGMSPWPARTRNAVCALADELAHQGAVGYAGWSRIEADAHRRMARLIGAESGDEIAFVRNTSDALSMVAHGLDWQPGDEVVVGREEFPSNRYPWESLAARGVVTRLVELGTTDPEAALIGAMTERTRLVAVSAVQYASGVRIDLPRLAAACRARGSLLCVDAIQQVGALPFDAYASGADFVALGSHKWLLGAEGVGVLWMRPAWRERLGLHAFGWHMTEHAGDFDAPTWTPAATARRFEPGTTNFPGIVALNASMSWLEDVGMRRVGDDLAARVEHLMSGLDSMPGVRLITPREPARRAGIVTFAHADRPAKALHAALVAAGVVCVPRAGGVRFAPHCYTPVSVLDRALTHVEDALRAA